MARTMSAYKVDKDPNTGIHKVVEQTVCVLLEGDIETSYAFAPRY